MKQVTINPDYKIKQKFEYPCNYNTINQYGNNSKCDLKDCTCYNKKLNLNYYYIPQGNKSNAGFGNLCIYDKLYPEQGRKINNNRGLETEFLNVSNKQQCFGCDMIDEHSLFRGGIDSRIFNKRYN